MKCSKSDKKIKRFLSPNRSVGTIDLKKYLRITIIES